MRTGIEGLSVYVPGTYLELADLAEARGVPAAKFTDGLGQRRMAVAPPDEDVVTMAAAAAAPLLEGGVRNTIDTVIVGTEGGVDASKASAIFVHRLLGLPRTCKAFEVKQACCGATCGLSMALDRVARNPDRRVLVIGSDIARYDLGSPGEPTQGAGAVAMLVSAQPRLLTLDDEWGSFTDDVMDFWRPAYRKSACVDGKYSVKVYLNALGEAWRMYAGLNVRRFDEHHRFCYHQPFTRMADKAHLHLARHAGVRLEGTELEAQIAAGQHYSALSGNCYTGSLYASLASLLDHEDDLAGRRIGMFSYGSGCMGAFFSGRVPETYRAARRADHHAALFASRTRIDVPTYEAWHRAALPEDGSKLELPRLSANRFRLTGVEEHRRLYAA